MKEIRNLKGEVVRTETSYGDRWWHFSDSTWSLVSGAVLLIIGCSVSSESFVAALRIFDVRLWPYELFVLIPVVAGYLFWCWRICRNWFDYDGDGKKHALNFVGFGAAFTVIISFLLLLSMTGRFFLFFRPLTDMLTRGVFSMAAVWRAVPVVVLSVPLIYFGKEWICGFWND